MTAEFGPRDDDDLTGSERAADELDTLREQYVDGEIDEQELGERAGEVWER
jgi:uncharacterized membrane protein